MDELEDTTQEDKELLRLAHKICRIFKLLGISFQPDEPRVLGFEMLLELADIIPNHTIRLWNHL